MLPRARPPRNPSEDTAEFIDLDVTDSQRLARAAQAVSKKADHLDVLVNNAGILMDRDNSVLTLTPEMATKTLDTNTLGPLRVTQAFLSLLQKSRAPRIINISSGAGQLSGELQSWAPAYSDFKDGPQCPDPATCRGAARLCGQLCLSGLGPHLDGRLERAALGRGRGRHHRLACGRGAAKSHRQVSARPRGD